MRIQNVALDSVAVFYDSRTAEALSGVRMIGANMCIVAITAARFGLS